MSQSLDPSRISEVLLIRPEKIGDMVVSLPVFEALRANFPRMHIALLASPRSRALVEHDPRLDTVFLYKKNLSDIGVLRHIRAKRFDVVIDMVHGDSVTSLIYSQLAGPRAFLIGVGKKDHAPYYDFNGMPRHGAPEHIVDVSLRLLEPFGLASESLNGFVPPYLTDDASRLADDFLASISNGDSRSLIGFNLSAGKPNRLWPLEKAADLVRKLSTSDLHPHLVVIVHPSERERGEKLLSLVDGAATIVPDGLGLIDVSAVIARLDLLITPDTSLVHVARSFRIPVVGLYNAAQKNLYLWQPYRQPEGVIASGHPDLVSDISVEEVFNRSLALLAAERERV